MRPLSKGKRRSQPPLQVSCHMVFAAMRKQQTGTVIADPWKDADSVVDCSNQVRTTLDQAT
jgi:hypothetical protein